MLTHIWAHRDTMHADFAEYASNVHYVFAVFIFFKNGQFNHDFGYQQVLQAYLTLSCEISAQKI